MLNVNELTSQMAKMSDAQLRQYAQLHKTDPYTLALAASESKRRSQLRAAGQQQAAQQPTVADQALAQMGAPAPMPQQMQQPQLPEQQGIGMLPAQNVEGMADGGIAGYDDQFVDSYADAYAGGGIVAFAGEGTSLVGPGGLTPEAQLQQVRERERQEEAARAQQTKGSAGFITGFEAMDANARQGMATTVRQKLQNNIPLNSTEENLVKNVPQFKDLVAAEMAKRPQPVNTTAPAATAPTTTAPTTTTTTTTTAPKDKGKRVVGPRAAAPVGRTPNANQAAIEKTMGFTPSTPSSLTEQFNIMKGLMPSGAEYDTLAAETEAGFAKRAREREASRPKDKAYTGLEALLGKEEEKAKGKEARNLNMALINAGLAIAGGKSQYALQNIAEGAQVGTKQYQEGLEKLEAAAIERRKQAAMIEEARRAEARGDWKEAEAFRQQAFEAGLGIKRDKIGAIAKITGDSLKAATERVNTQEQIYSQDRRALMQEQGLNVRAREQNVADLQRARIMASAYGGRSGANQNLPNVVWDNASKLHEKWLASPEGKLASLTEGAADAKFQEFLRQAAQFQGIPMPNAAPVPGAVPGGAKFLGFE